ncbi:hypothetical protein [Stetteria hydrogenophila]
MPRRRVARELAEVFKALKDVAGALEEALSSVEAAVFKPVTEPLEQAFNENLLRELYTFKFNAENDPRVLEEKIRQLTGFEGSVEEFLREFIEGRKGGGSAGGKRLEDETAGSTGSTGSGQ